MKKIILAIILMGIGSIARSQFKQSDLRILYVGGTDNTSSVLDNKAKLNAEEVKARMASFEQMLKKYFKNVDVLHAKDYQYRISENYDVTVMDGVPQAIVAEEREQHISGRMVVSKPTGYFPEDFDRPVLTIAEMGDKLGRRIGLKTDWYCLCLDANAHSLRTEHPIFHGPFPVTLTLQMKPTPSDAFHYAYFIDHPLPDSLAMWQVQTKGYMTDRNYRAGMVARPWGFEDSPDAEYISSGVCAKTLDAVALGRHANFFHWGFVSSPADLTTEAQTVLANAIVYISQFAGQKPIARKYVSGIATREYLKEKKFYATRKGWQESEQRQREFEQRLLNIKANALAKQKRGKKLTQEEEMYLDYEPNTPLTYAEFLQENQKELYPRFGEDEAAYLRYYDENRDYFYGGEGIYHLVIDEDVKSIGIPNNDLRLLETAIDMLGREEEADKARRILHRYTLCRFETPQEWRMWYESNKNRLFFTETGGWLFMVDTQEKVAGNDYHVRTPQSTASTLPRPEATDEENPVQIATGSNRLANGNWEIVIRFNIHIGYHIYAHVSESDAFIPTTVDIELPEGYRKVGKLKRSSFKGFNDRGTTIYEKEAVFRQEIAGKDKGQVTCTIGYQCCNSQVCMPPVEKKYIVNIQ